MSRKVLAAVVVVSIVTIAGFIGARSLLASPEKAVPEPVLPSAGQSYFPTGNLTDEQGAVVVDVSQLNLNDSNDSDTLDFVITLDTHSVDLDMDLAQNAFLTTDTDLTIAATQWDAPSGGHHVSGTLSFPARLGDQRVLEGAERVTLTLANVDVPERVFLWEIQPAN